MAHELPCKRDLFLLEQGQNSKWYCGSNTTSLIVCTVFSPKIHRRKELLRERWKITPPPPYSSCRTFLYRETLKVT